MTTPKEHDNLIRYELHRADDALYQAWRHAIPNSNEYHKINEAQNIVQSLLRAARTDSKGEAKEGE